MRGWARAVGSRVPGTREAIFVLGQSVDVNFAFLHVGGSPLFFRWDMSWAASAQAASFRTGWGMSSYARDCVHGGLDALLTRTRGAALLRKRGLEVPVLNRGSQVFLARGSHTGGTSALLTWTSGGFA